ncbi:MAG: ferrous iron transport protein [Bacteroidota bacterium]|jgi:ferrous iron transport protein B
MSTLSYVFVINLPTQYRQRLNNTKTVALVGNPNSGKTSLFNVLTGLNQKVGNFSGVTVDSSSGIAQLPNAQNIRCIDLPGTYSLYPKSADEYVAYDALLNDESGVKPDAVIIVVDASNLKRNLLFCSQILDLGLPAIVALTMNDIAARNGIRIDETQLSIQLGVPVVQVNPLKGRGKTNLLKQVQMVLANASTYRHNQFIDNDALAPELVAAVQQQIKHKPAYACLHLAVAADQLNFVPQALKENIAAVKQSTNFSKTRVQSAETMQRYARIKQVMHASVVEADPLRKELRTEKLDRTLLHPIWGNLILLVVLFLLFQSIYWLSAFPTEWIETGFSSLSNFLSEHLPKAAWSNLLINGVLAGLGGVIGFVPQIAILFALITILEDSGYMARIGFLSDRLMRSVGLNGKAVLPLISGVACAVPAIMSTRTIENKTERLIALLVTPLMSCSARIPVYTILIGLVIPKVYFLGFIGLQGLVMMALYLFGFILALLASKVLSIFLRKKSKSAFLMELPVYREPRWHNLLVNVWHKARMFVVDAGKIIVIISVILWALCNYGPGDNIAQIRSKYATQNAAEAKAAEANEVLVASYAGHLGRFIEPAIKPLGFDWKIGIALIASFAAREVFVGTMATLYSAVDVDDNGSTLTAKMRAATWPDGKPIYSLPTGVSLLIFYAIAMQCMTTMGIVVRETRSWKFAIAQFVALGVLAYLCSWLAYSLLA